MTIAPAGASPEPQIPEPSPPAGSPPNLPPNSPPSGGPASSPDRIAPHPLRPESPGLPAAPLAHLSFFQLPAVHTLLPLGTSIVFHIAIILVGFFLYKGVQAVVANVAQEQITIPDTTMVKDAQAGGIPNPGLDDPSRIATQDKVESNDADGWSNKNTPLSQSLARDQIESGDKLAEPDKSNFGPIGNLDGAGAGNNDSLAAFGPAGGGQGLGPKAVAFGTTGNAFKIAYVCDASGSMLSKMPQLKDELNKAVTALEPVQAFNVIFFSDPDIHPTILADHLLMANPDNKVKFNTFIQGVNAAGSTDPIPGLEVAFRQHPQLIFLLTDGDFPDNDKVLKRVRELDKDKSVRLNTVVFTDPKDADKGIVQLMQTLADEFGGQCRVVSPDDLQ
jgi:hypothetical protein